MFLMISGETGGRRLRKTERERDRDWDTEKRERRRVGEMEKETEEKDMQRKRADGQDPTWIGVSEEAKVRA